MRKQRMTEEEYLQAIADVENIKKQIEELRKQKTKLRDKIRWYEYTKDETREDYASGFCMQHFGKRQKDLTTEELKEYRRLLTKKSREKKRA